MSRRPEHQAPPEVVCTADFNYCSYCNSVVVIVDITIVVVIIAIHLNAFF